MTKHRRTRNKNRRTRRRTQKGGFGESIVEPIKNTSINVINATENGLTKVTDFLGNTWASTKNALSNLFSTNTSAISYGGKRTRRRR
jgi:hypothetical protein